MARRLRRRDDDAGLAEEAHEINVTPFIDVILVLLIVFMVAAPLATVDVPVDLPGSTARPAQRPPAPLYLTAQADGSLTLGAHSVTPGALGAALDRASGGDRGTRVFLRADRGLSYGAVMAVMNRLRDAGYLKIALVGLETGGVGGQGG
ncbi:TonB system transport protein ExbD [Acidimangrovimonas sediminis]|uniref:TonB system transport protein ExbD n=1 Tax=Acidimangrovimonas sediminis TaxID=2056283 RepID=UPI000C7FC3CF|nr:TonB system transport protein ExbD [Acidimangrovimonas sediminis]